MRHFAFYFFASMPSLALLFSFKLNMKNSDHFLILLLKLSITSLSIFYLFLLYFFFKKNKIHVRYDLFIIFLVLTADIAIYINFEVEMFDKGAEYYLLTIRTVFFMTKILIFYDFNFEFKLKKASLSLGIIFVIVFLKILNSNEQDYFILIWFILEYILLIGCFTIVLSENQSDKAESFSNFINEFYINNLSPLLIVTQINEEILEKMFYNDSFEKLIGKNNLKFSFLNSNFKNYFLVLKKKKRTKTSFQNYK